MTSTRDEVDAAIRIVRQAIADGEVWTTKPVNRALIVICDDHPREGPVWDDMIAGAARVLYKMDGRRQSAWDDQSVEIRRQYWDKAEAALRAGSTPGS
jgi:hypothetical protein